MFAIVSYQSAFIQLENKDDTVKNATDALANKHPKNSYIAKMDEAGNIKIYDVDGNEVGLLFVLFCQLLRR
jgi:hypothetical protein